MVWITSLSRHIARTPAGAARYVARVWVGGRMSRTVLIVSANHRLTGVALRVLGRHRQRAWIFNPDDTPPARSRWRAGVVKPVARDLGAAIVEAARAVGATHVIPDEVVMFAAVAEVASALAPGVAFPSVSATDILRFDSKAEL